MAMQVQGNSGTIAEVEAASRALRVTARPLDFGSLGAYSTALPSLVMAAGLAANAEIFQARWVNTNLCLVRSVRFGAGGIVAFAAGIVNIMLRMARSWSAVGGGGVGITFGGNDQKRRTSMGQIGFAANDMRVSQTAALTAGTKALDGNDIGNLVSSTTATAGTVLIPAGSELLPDDRDMRYPLVLANQEGPVIRATVPATGTWTFGVSFDHEEVTSY